MWEQWPAWGDGFIYLYLHRGSSSKGQLTAYNSCLYDRLISPLSIVEQIFQRQESRWNPDETSRGARDIH